MANYSLTVNSTFQPFSYQELAAPLDRQELYHEKLAEEYDKLSTQADVLEAMGQNDRDKASGAYNRYKAYSDKLRKEADSLYKFGLNTESRQRLSDLRRAYNTDIVPIQNAWSKRKKEADEQMEALLRNPSIMFTRDARTTTLNDYIKNPTGGYGVINGANITAQMATMAKNLATQVREGRKENIDPYTYNYIEKYGLDENIIRNWQDSPTLKTMFEQVMQANGVTPEALKNSLNSQSIIDKSRNYAEMGMWNALGDTKSHIQENYGERLNARAAKEISTYRKKKEIDQEDAQPENPTGGTMSESLYQLPMRGADYSNATEQSNAMKNLGYVSKDGKLHYTGKVTLTPVGDPGIRMSRILELNQKEIEQGMLSNAEREERSKLQAEARANYGKKPKSKEFRLYDNSGKLLSRDKFIAQGADEQEKKTLQQYYSKVEEANRTLGLSGNYHHSDLSKHYNNLRRKDAAQIANVRALNYEKGDWNPTSKNYQVREITSYQKGNPVYSTKPISLGELLERKDSNKNDINVAPYWSEVEGQEGLILATTEDGKAHRYFISAESMPESNVQRARYFFNVASQYYNRGNAAEAKEALEAGYRALGTGLTMHNKGYEQSIVRQPSLKQQDLAD